MCSIFHTFAKIIIVIFNILILVGAGLLIYFGVALKTHEESGLDSFDEFSISNLAIALGALSALIAFFGCCGAWRENSCLLSTYAAILFTLFIVQVVLCILAFVAIKNGDLELDEKIEHYVREWFNKHSSDSDKAFHVLEEDLECCGITSFLDYLSPILPDQCCSDGKTCPITSSKVYKTGCAKALTDSIKSNSKLIGGIAVGFGAVELLGAIFALYVKNSIRKSSVYA